MKNIYCSILLLLFALSNNVKANCPVNNAPSNLSASGICEKGFTTFSGTLNDVNNTLVWLDTANRIIGSGNNFQYYVSDVGLNFKAAEVAYDLVSAGVGPLPSQFNTTYPSQNFANGQYFSCLSAIRIDSILLRSNNPLQGNIQVWSKAPENGGYVLQKFPFNITANGPSNTRVALGAILNTGNYFINIEITSGTGILYRALSGASYPYQVNNLLSITGNNFNASNDRYYYFFDWDVSKMCMGPLSNAFSPVYTQTLAETLPYNETFISGIPCDWTNQAPSVNAQWQSGSSASLSSSSFPIPLDPNIIISSDIGCNCDKSSSLLMSPWFDLRGFSKETSMELNIPYVYKEVNNSKVYIRIKNSSNTISLLDSFSNQMGSYSTKVIDLRSFILSDSVQISIEHRDNGGDNSAIAISALNINQVCSTSFSAKLNVLLDSYASEISWEIRDALTNEVVAKNIPYTDNVPYQPANAVDARNICLIKDRSYIFKIQDSFGDGLNDGVNTGTYLLSTDCGDTLLFGSGALPYGGLVLPERAWDSVVFKARNYTPELGPDQTISLDDTLILDAGEIGPYVWSTGDTTRTIAVNGNLLGTGNYSYSVSIRGGICQTTTDTILITVVGVYKPLIKINLRTDTKGSEIKWELRDALSDTVIMSKGPFADVIPYNVNAATHIDSVYVEFNQELIFKVIDLAGDGLFDESNQGVVSISNNCMPVIYQNNSKTFSNTEGTSSFDSIVFNANVASNFNIGNDFAICEGEILNLDAGSSANEYIWNINNTTVTGNPIAFSSEVLLLGENMVIVKNNANNSCFSSDTIIITKKEKPLNTFQTTQQAGLLTCEANFVGAVSYSWNFGDGNTGTGKNITHTYASNGSYTVSLNIESSNGCINSSSKNIVINGVGINNEQEKYTLHFYPNPSSGIVKILSEQNQLIDLQIIDLQGRILIEKKNLILNGEYSLHLENLAAGTYISRIKTDEGIQTKKIIIEK